jgi:hypothetical protein
VEVRKGPTFPLFEVNDEVAYQNPGAMVGGLTTSVHRAEWSMRRDARDMLGKRFSPRGDYGFMLKIQDPLLGRISVPDLLGTSFHDLHRHAMFDRFSHPY